MYSRFSSRFFRNYEIVYYNNTQQCSRERVMFYNYYYCNNGKYLKFQREFEGACLEFYFCRKIN